MKAEYTRMYAQFSLLSATNNLKSFDVHDQNFNRLEAEALNNKWQGQEKNFGHAALAINRGIPTKNGF